MLNELDNLQRQIEDLQRINDKLTSLSEDQRKSLDQQSEQLQSFANSLSFTSLENKILFGVAGGLAVVAVVEGVVILVRR